MSSFINTRRHFDSIAAGMKLLFRYQDFFIPDNLRKHLPGELLNPGKPDTDRVDELVERLMNLQILSVCNQYCEGSPEKVAADVAEQMAAMGAPGKNPLTLNSVLLVKALDCAMYQIEEEYLTKYRALTEQEKDCLAFFEGFVNHLAGYIVRRSEQYENFTWAIS